MSLESIHKALSEMEEREKAATKGPWKELGGMIGPGIVVAQTWDKHEDDFPNAEANEAFIAHSRQDLPKLIKALRVALQWIPQKKVHAEISSILSETPQ